MESAVEKSKTSPNAALGLLDILASQNAFAAERSVLPTLSEAIELSRRENSAFDHLRFLLTLLGKFAGRPVPLSLLRLIRISSDSYATKPEGSHRIPDLCGQRCPAPTAVLCESSADAIASMPADTSVAAFSGLNPETRLTLISASEAMGEMLVRSLLENRSMAWGGGHSKRSGISRRELTHTCRGPFGSKAKSRRSVTHFGRRPR